MGIMINRRRVMGKKLPYDAEIEYLESSGTQYITTSFIPDYNTTIEFEVYLPDFAQNKHFIYGAGTSLIKNMEVYTWNDVTMNVNGNRVLSSEGVPTTEFIKLFMSSSRISISNHQNELIAERTFTTNDFTCDSSLILFGIQRGIKIFVGWDKIKRLRVYDRNIPVFDFIPVRIGTTGYMYDRVSKQLFGNAGTGEFILGPDKN